LANACLVKVSQKTFLCYTGTKIRSTVDKKVLKRFLNFYKLHNYILIFSFF